MGEGGPWRGRPPEVRALVALHLAGAGLCLVGALWPPTPRSPVELNAALAVVGTVVGALVWWAGTRLPDAARHSAILVFTAGTTATVAEAATGEGALSAAMAYVWLCVYAALSSSQRAARAHTALAVTGLALGLRASAPVASGASAWLVVAISSVVACELLSRFHAQLRARSVTDALTGLLDRGGLVQAARREVAARSGAPLTVAVIDLDGFKLVNDRDGHAAGDRLLVDLAEAWTTALRPRDVLCRVGGDEFVLLLPDTDEDAAAALLARLLAVSPTGWSHGVSAVGPDDDLDACLARADVRMYERKRAGRRADRPSEAGPGERGRDRAA